MTALRILILCICAAFICTAIRTQHPQIASAVALAVGIAALMLSVSDIRMIAETIENLESYARKSGVNHVRLLKLCGIAVISEFASDICCDSGEISLAHRIDAGVRIAILASALPSVAEILSGIAAVLE